MKKLLPLLAIMLLGAGCAASQNASVPPAQSPVATPPVSTNNEAIQHGVVSVKRRGWSTYANSELGFQIDFPSSWKVGEYYIAARTLDTVAFDPTSVITQDEFTSIDLAPGRFTIRRSDATPTGARVTIGNGIPATEVIQKYDANSPNPWWQNRTDRSYYFHDPKISGTLQIDIQYPNELANDKVVQQQLTDMLASFQLLK